MALTIANDKKVHRSRSGSPEVICNQCGWSKACDNSISADFSSVKIMYNSSHPQPTTPLIADQPIVYPDQRSQFKEKELFRKLSRESEVSIFIYKQRIYLYARFACICILYIYAK